MSLKARITEDMKTAMRSGEKDRLGLIRMLMAGIKQRKDSVTQFEAGGRSDLAARESAEIAWLTDYLPAQMSDAEVDALIKDAIAATGAASMKDMGKVMGMIKPKAQGRTDMGALSARIKAALSA